MSGCFALCGVKKQQLILVMASRNSQNPSAVLVVMASHNSQNPSAALVVMASHNSQNPSAALVVMASRNSQNPSAALVVMASRNSQNPLPAALLDLVRMFKKQTTQVVLGACSLCSVVPSFRGCLFVFCYCYSNLVMDIQLHVGCFIYLILMCTTCLSRAGKDH